MVGTGAPSHRQLDRLIVLADFTNTTADSVFDESLKRALAVSLQQSLFLSLLSDEQVQQTLRMMNAGDIS